MGATSTDGLTAKSRAQGAARVRPLAAQDLDAVVAIDESFMGRSRPAYFERRLAAAQREPGLHVQLAAIADGALCGYVLGRALEGEFGSAATALRLEVIGVRPDARGRGIGALLGEAFEAEARRHGLAELRTAALWREHAMLRFLDRSGYRLAREHVLDCALANAELGSPRETPVAPGGERGPGDLNDYSAPPPNDFDALARDTADIRRLEAQDLEGIVRIDRRLTGQDRRRYLERALAEALHDSAIRVSLALRRDGALAGYIMARLDLGDFGRAEPVAAIDTVGVDPLRARQGVGRALLSQLFVNLAALGVERVETVVSPRDLDLLGFFYETGFVTSERLGFVKRLA